MKRNQQLDTWKRRTGVRAAGDKKREEGKRGQQGTGELGRPGTGEPGKKFRGERKPEEQGMRRNAGTGKE